MYVGFTVYLPRLRGWLYYLATRDILTISEWNGVLGPLHSEIAPCLSSPTKQRLYSSEIASDFWDTRCSSPGRFILPYASIFDQCDDIDLTPYAYTILQSLKSISAVSRASLTFFFIYMFSYQEPGQTSSKTMQIHDYAASAISAVCSQFSSCGTRLHIVSFARHPFWSPLHSRADNVH